MYLLIFHYSKVIGQVCLRTQNLSTPSSFYFSLADSNGHKVKKIMHNNITGCRFVFAKKYLSNYKKTLLITFDNLTDKSVQ